MPRWFTTLPLWVSRLAGVGGPRLSAGPLPFASAFVSPGVSPWALGRGACWSGAVSGWGCFVMWLFPLFPAGPLSSCPSMGLRAAGGVMLLPGCLSPWGVYEGFFSAFSSVAACSGGWLACALRPLISSSPAPGFLRRSTRASGWSGRPGSSAGLRSARLVSSPRSSVHALVGVLCHGCSCGVPSFACVGGGWTGCFLMLAGLQPAPGWCWASRSGGGGTCGSSALPPGLPEFLRQLALVSTSGVSALLLALGAPGVASPSGPWVCRQGLAMPPVYFSPPGSVSASGPCGPVWVWVHLQDWSPPQRLVSSSGLGVPPGLGTPPGPVIARWFVCSSRPVFSSVRPHVLLRGLSASPGFFVLRLAVCSLPGIVAASGPSVLLLA